MFHSQQTTFPYAQSHAYGRSQVGFPLYGGVLEPGMEASSVQPQYAQYSTIRGPGAGYWYPPHISGPFSGQADIYYSNFNGSSGYYPHESLSPAHASSLSSAAAPFVPSYMPSQAISATKVGGQLSMPMLMAMPTALPYDTASHNRHQGQQQHNLQDLSIEDHKL